MAIKQITIKVIKRGRATDYRVEVKPDKEGEQPRLTELIHLLAVAQQILVEHSYVPEKPEKQP